MVRFITILCLLCAATVVAAQEIAVIVPNSVPSLNRSFVFADPAGERLILLYEKRIVSPTTLALETRRIDNLKPMRRRVLQMLPNELLRLAEYHPPYGVFAIVQSYGKASMLVINPETGERRRSLLYTIGEAKQLDVSVNRIVVAGLTWNSRLNRAMVLLNLVAGTRTIALLASTDSAGVRLGTPARIDAGKGIHTDLAFNSCQGELAATTTDVVRLVRGARARNLETPEEIAFDSSHCRYGVVRRPFTQIPDFLFLGPSLAVQSVKKLPGGVAPGLIATTRDQLQYLPGRQSWFYPTVARHQRLYLNEITPAEVRTRLLETPIDAGSLSVAAAGNSVYLLISGLQFGIYERLHRLILVKSNLDQPPSSSLLQPLKSR